MDGQSCFLPVRELSYTSGFQLQSGSAILKLTPYITSIRTPEAENSSCGILALRILVSGVMATPVHPSFDVSTPEKVLHSLADPNGL